MTSQTAAFVAAVEGAITGAFDAGAERVAQQARADAPSLRSASRFRVPGQLRGAIKAEKTVVGDGQVRGGVSIDQATAFYGRFQEEGFHAVGGGRGGNASTRFVPGLRFMRRALESNRQAIADDVARRVSVVIDQANE